MFDLKVRGGVARRFVQASPFRDLDQLRTSLAGGGPGAILDLPWMPLYLNLLFPLHPLIRVFGLVGIIPLAGLTWATDQGSAPPRQVAFRVDTISAEVATDDKGGVSFYQAGLKIDPESLPPDLRGRLAPGMPAEVQIQTASRNALSFFLKPLSDQLARTFREE